MTRKLFVAGNWKMYTNLAEAKQLAGAIAKGVTTDAMTVAVCPPFPWLTTVAEVIKGSHVKLGGQDCAIEKEGAYTGQVSAPMLLDAGCQYAIIGHSERRHGLNEKDELLNKKAHGALAAGLEVIFCIGELLAEREGNQTESVLERQLALGLAGMTAEQLKKLVIAYEPVWAIGTGKVATEQQAQDAHAFIRQTIAKQFGKPAADGMVIQYGGSVKPDNAAKLLALPDVDGCLVGGASLKPELFLPIIQAGVDVAGKKSS